MPAKRMTIAAAMKMGAVLPDVERTTTWGAPTLKVRGKMTYYLKPHYEDYPCVLARLSRIQPDALRDLLRMGWEFARSRAKRKSSRPVSRARGNG